MGSPVGGVRLVYSYLTVVTYHNVSVKLMQSDGVNIDTINCYIGVVMVRHVRATTVIICLKPPVAYLPRLSVCIVVNEGDSSRVGIDLIKLIKSLI